MDGFRDLASSQGLHLVEDCAQAHGAQFRGQAVGSFGDIAAWSFCQDKIITTGGEGGMVTTDRPELSERVWSYKDHGKSREALLAAKSAGHGFPWVHEGFGTNWRLTEMQSAIGRIQLRRMPEWHAARARNAKAILASLENNPVIRAPSPPDHIEHAWYRCYVFVRPENLKSGWSRDRMLDEITNRGVPCRSGVCPEVYREPAFVGASLGPRERLPVARELGETSLMLLVHPTLTGEEIARTCDALVDVARAACR
jgi:dTDP-4-amino-4,6-dideoxygalactose transaminase